MKFRKSNLGKILKGKTYLARRCEAFGFGGVYKVTPERFYETTVLFGGLKNIWECRIVDVGREIKGPGWWFLEKDFIKRL